MIISYLDIEQRMETSTRFCHVGVFGHETKHQDFPYWRHRDFDVGAWRSRLVYMSKPLPTTRREALWVPDLFGRQNFAFDR